MTMNRRTSPPRRWLDPGSDAQPEVRETLSRALRAHEPAGRVARLEERLLPLFGAPPGAWIPEPSTSQLGSSAVGGSSTVAGGGAASGKAAALSSSALPAGGTAASGILIKLVVAVAVAGAGGAGIAAQLASKPEIQPLASVTRHIGARSAGAVARARVAAPSSPPVARAAELPVANQSPTVPRPARAPAQNKPPPAGSSLDAEALLLSRARAIAPVDPAGARALLMEHARQFPSGALGQERQLFLIELSLQNGERDVAERHLRELEASAPDSPHLERARTRMPKK
jgi:hypothetical protein